MVTLVHGSVLLLAPLAWLLILLGSLKSAPQGGRLRRVASTFVRCLIVLLLTLALGGPVTTRIEPLPRFTAWLLDCSESVSPKLLQRSVEELRPRWDREVAAGHRCALVAFGGRPRIAIPPGASPLPPGPFVPPEGLERNATDLSAAFDTARGLFQESAANRIVLLSDGIDTRRPAAFLSMPPATLGVRLSEPDRVDCAIVDVQAPAALRSGEPFEVRVVIQVGAPGPVSISAMMDEEPPQPDAVVKFNAPSAGRHVVLLPPFQKKRVLSPGVHRLLVMADQAGDTERRNNVGIAPLTVTGKPRILLVEGAPSEGEFLARLLKAQDIDYVRQSPAEMTARAETLDEFVGVILAGVPREALSADSVAALRTFVATTGGGLWVCGGAALQGSRGYAGSELEKLLPVSFKESVAPSADPAPPGPPPPAPPPPPPPPNPEDAKPQKVLAPSVALLLLVDKSGSMAGRNIEIVKESCIATAKALSRRDVIGVIAFDSRPHWLLEFTEAERIDYITERILRLYADGGTNIFPALIEAYRGFELDPRAKRCAVKHCVLLSDGDTPGADFEPLVRRMAEEGITVSTVCVSGAKFDAVLMSQIASWGRGRFKFTNSFSNVPQLILNEAQKIVASVPKDDANPPPPAPAIKNEPPPAIVQKPEPPKPKEPPALEPVLLKDAHEVLQGIDGKDLPGLRGRLGAVARPRAEVPLASKDGSPVLALGRLGLGKTAVWAADLSGGWSADWVKWKDSPKLFAQIVRYVAGAGPDEELAARVRVTRDGSRARLRIDSGAPVRVSDGAGQPIALVPDSDDSEQTFIPLEHPGEMKRILLQRADGRKLALGVVRACEDEFLPPDPSRDLFASALPPQTWAQVDARLQEPAPQGERRRDLSLWLVVAALLLLPLDVALRRVHNG